MSGLNKRLRQTLDITNIVRTNFLTSKIHNNFNVRKQITNFFCSPPYFYLPTRDKFAPPFTSQDLAQNLFK